LSLFVSVCISLFPSKYSTVPYSITYCTRQHSTIQYTYGSLGGFWLIYCYGSYGRYSTATVATVASTTRTSTPAGTPSCCGSGTLSAVHCYIMLRMMVMMKPMWNGGGKNLLDEMRGGEQALFSTAVRRCAVARPRRPRLAAFAAAAISSFCYGRMHVLPRAVFALQFQHEIIIGSPSTSLTQVSAAVRCSCAAIRGSCCGRSSRKRVLPRAVSNGPCGNSEAHHSSLTHHHHHCHHTAATFIITFSPSTT